MIRRWLYGSAGLLILLNASCQSGGTSSTKADDSTQIAASDHDHSGHNHGPDGEGGTTYTCPMHPQIVQSAPGTCPICSMDLVAVGKTGTKAGERSDASVMLSASQMQLANITVQPVSSGSIGNSTVLNARLAADQQQTDVISSRVAGRIERLYVKETGQTIRKGQVLYEIYSEPLLTQQQEYLIALQQEQEMGNGEASNVSGRYSQFRQAAEQKLRLYGMTAEQIAVLGRTRKVLPRIPFVAPAGGTVTEIAASEGQYVGEGALLYRLVNLGQLWVEAELYAGEAKFVKVGDRVSVQVIGYEGDLTARVAFINPEYQAGSQVLIMRAVLANPGGRYQPGQQAQVLLRHGVQRGLTLPVDAVVRGGEGAVVFVQTGPGSFQPRRVQTGTETDQRVVITSGLNGEETIAMSGAYLLYSELILKKGVNPFTKQADEAGVKSTPNAETNPAPIASRQAGSTPVSQSGEPVPELSSGKPTGSGAPDAFKKQLTGVYEASLKLTESLIGSNSGGTKVAATGVEKALSGVDMKQISGQAHTDWMKNFNSMNAALKTIRSTGDLDKQRTAYAQFEDGLYRSVKAFGIMDKPVYRQYCPMALNNKGSYWLSDKKPIRNPFFGDQMLTCGETKEEIN